ncbi:S1 RNA-binding domain-containing protein [Clostridium sp.]|uniref:S1 RNA-binding domain-containing protein n=1 Tax=Clostridium sp. TaxID=1506 RepID=UPI001B499070|nr:S1 RNA-binding domain-containing protein [Clostridium sp.]MBP3917193.1 S1 RNA-binding domain-containing protein [Clostridium sp.]
MKDKFNIGDIVNVEFKMTVKDQDGKTAIVGEAGDYTVIVYNDRIADGNTKKVIIELMGVETPVKVIDVIESEKFIVGDIREGREKIKEEIAKKLEDRQAVRGKIVKLFSYGAYIDCDGIAGFLKNVNFSDNYVSISDVYNVGDEIEVTLLRKSNTGKYSFQAKEKYHGESENIDNYAIDDIRIGKVVSTKPFGTFVRLGVNLDAICPPLKSIVVEEGDKVVIQITEVIKEERKIRALIKKVIRE